MRCSSLLCLLSLLNAASAQPGKGNRLAYLDEVDAYYPSHTFPKLTTPMWVGDNEVEAVVVLGIDDMKDPKKYEAFLRPILRRLKDIDGRAPVSIMTCSVDPKDPQLQTWLKEGLSLECHTYDHPCPLFKGGFIKTKGLSYGKCLDLLHAVPNNKPVAFRVPCCDSINTPSPRFYAEIFNTATPDRYYLQIDSSVFNVFTSKDPQLPKKLVLDDHGQERFLKYLPKDRDFVNYIENYPYPYVIGRLCWQFPCMTPSDWQAQHLQKPNNPKTVEDWKAALDCTVLKQGVFCMVFHPHGWIRNDQVVEFIDHAVKKHGKKVKFLTFKEACDCLTRNMLRNPLRSPVGYDFGVRLIDLNNDGYLDVVTGHQFPQGQPRTWTTLWRPMEGKWDERRFFAHPAMINSDGRRVFDTGYRWGVFHSDARPTYAFWRYDIQAGTFDGKKWTLDKALAAGQKLIVDARKVPSSDWPSVDRGNRFRDIDGDGICELIVANPWQSTVFTWDGKERTWTELPFVMPPGARFVNADGTDAGLRLLDLDGDGKLDIIFSNEKEYGIYLFENMEKGWSKKIMAGKAGDKNALPMIGRNGTNNGFWVHSGHLWWANEDTALLKNHVDKRSIKELLKAAEK